VTADVVVSGDVTGILIIVLLVLLILVVAKKFL